MFREVEDPELLSQLNSDTAENKQSEVPSSVPGYKEVTNPDVLKILNSDIPNKNVKKALDKNIGILPKIKRAAGILSEDISKIPSSIGKSIISGINAAPSEISGYYHQAINDPQRLIKNLLIGAGKVEQGAMNISSGHTPSKYLAHLGLISPESILSGQTENIANKYVGDMGKEQKGDVLIQGIHQVLPFMGINKIPGIVTAKSIAKYPFEKVKQTIKEAEIRPNSAIERQTAADIAAGKHQNYVNELEKAEQEAGEETGRSTEETLNNAFKVKNEKLSDLVEPEISNLPVPSVNESIQNVENAERQHTQSQRNQENIEHDIRRELNYGADHDVQAAGQLLRTQEQRRRGISDVYDQLTDRFSQRNVVIDNTEQIQNNIQQLRTLIQENQGHTRQAQRINEEIHRLQNEPNVIPADRYLTTLRAAKDYAREARQKAFKPDMNAEERAEWAARYNELDDTIEAMEDNLESSVGPEDFEQLQAANQSWRQFIKPMQRNSTYQEIFHRGRINGDIINKIRGTDPGDVLMRDMIRRDPEILRNVVGQRYANNIPELHNIGAREAEYINLMPSLRRSIVRHAQATQNVAENNINLQNIRNRHEQILQQERRAQELSEKERTKSKEVKDKRIKLENEIKEIEKHLEKIRQIKKNKKMSLEQKVKTENEYNSFIKKRNKARKNLLLVAGGYPAFKVGSYLLEGKSGEKENVR